MCNPLGRLQAAADPDRPRVTSIDILGVQMYPALERAIVLDSYLPAGCRQVEIHRLRGDFETSGDFFVTQTILKAFEHLALATCEPHRFGVHLGNPEVS